MNQVKIKICGLTRDEDVKSAIAVGTDAVGFVFTKSPRRISIDTAVRLVGHVPNNVLRIGLFLDQDRSDIDRVLRSVPLDVLQFHGRETEQECTIYGLPWLKAVAMEHADSARQAEQQYPGSMGLLLDSHSSGGRGGSGKTFDWSLSRSLAKPVWLAGGLNAENVGRAISLVKPYAVDVSSGVESSPGIKDTARMADFVKAVKAINFEV
jgi:phosphoribosylanthranilate isomerase